MIAVSGAALEFLLKYRAELFTGVPIVQCSVAGDPHPNNLHDAKIAGVPVIESVSSTLEIALRLHPETRQVVVVTGNGPRYRQMADELRGEIGAFENRVAVRWLTNLSIQEQRGELSRLPDHTVVLYVTMFRDAAGASFMPRQALDQFATASRAPIYGFYDTFIGHGIVGGSMVTFEEIGRRAAQLGIRILAGEDAQTAARSESLQAVPMFDWRELRRWNISEKRLPPGSVVRFRKTIYWEEHRWLIFGVVFLCVLEALLIGALLIQLHRRRRAEKSLRESEERLSLAADAANLGIWIRDLVGDRIWASDKWRELFGFEKAERLNTNRFFQRLHSGDRDAVSQALRKAQEAGGVTKRSIAALDWLPTFVEIAGGPKGDELNEQIQAGKYPGIVKTKLDGFNQIDYLTGKSDKSAREYFFYYSGSTPSAVRFKNWKMYYNMAPPGAEGWIMPLVPFHFTLVQNIMRDPFEQAVGMSQKTVNGIGGALAGPFSAFLYDWNMLPIGQMLWYEELMSYKEFPPMQAPETWNLDMILEQVKKANHQSD